MIQFFTDTDTDITLAEARRMNFGLISMPYKVLDREEYPYNDYEYFDSERFYNMLRDGIVPTTDVLSVDKYIQYFEPCFSRGNDIFYVHFSAAMTKTFDNMYKALDKLKDKYPNRKFYEVDTKGITILSYVIVKEIAALRDAGKTPEEIIEWAKTEVDHYAVYFFADDLKFFKHSGRVSGLTARLGNMLGLRPIICMTSDGIMQSTENAYGRSGAIKKIFNYLDILGDDVPNHKIVIGHSDALNLANEVIANLKKKYGDKLDIEIKAVNPTAGSHCGPDGVGICFHSKSREQ